MTQSAFLVKRLQFGFGGRAFVISLDFPNASIVLPPCLDYSEEGKLIDSAGSTEMPYSTPSMLYE